MTKVAIFGSCITRDNFNTKFNKNYKDFFEISLFQNQVSMLSIMSNQIDISDTELKTDHEKWTLNSEAQKNFLNQKALLDSDYLIVDFFADTYFGSIILNDSDFFTNNSKYSSLTMFKEKKKITPYDNFVEYFRIWKTKTRDFFDLINKLAPDLKIILVNTKFADIFEDKSSLTEYRKKYNISVFDVDMLNFIYNNMFKYIRTTHSVEVIDMTTDEYFLDRKHPWGPFYVHYEQDFYHDFFSKLQKIVLTDMEKNNRITLESLDDLNVHYKDLNQKFSELLNLYNEVIERNSYLENESMVKRIKRKISKK